MGGNGNGLLIPARFLVTIGHLVAIIMIQSTMVSVRSSAFLLLSFEPCRNPLLLVYF